MSLHEDAARPGEPGPVYPHDNPCASQADHGDCEAALARVQEFLHNELSEEEADLIRAHLEGCENCLEDFDTEAMIARLVRRSCTPPSAPMTLRVRLMSLRITTYRTEI